MAADHESGRKANQPTSFWLSDDTRDSLARLSEELGLNRSAVVREAIRRMAADDHHAEVRRLVRELEHAVSGGGDG